MRFGCTCSCSAADLLRQRGKRAVVYDAVRPLSRGLALAVCVACEAAGAVGASAAQAAARPGHPKYLAPPGNSADARIRCRGDVDPAPRRGFRARAAWARRATRGQQRVGWSPLGRRHRDRTGDQRHPAGVGSFTSRRGAVSGDRARGRGRSRDTVAGARTRGGRGRADRRGQAARVARRVTPRRP